MEHTKGKCYAEKEKDGASDEWFVKCDIGDNENVDICSLLADTELQEPEANAKHIVRCVNSHDALLYALGNALVSLAVIAMPRLDDNVTSDAQLLEIMKTSFQDAIAQAQK